MHTLILTSPRPLQVVQRTRLTPGLGRGAMRVSGSGAPATATSAEVRTVLCAEAFGQGTDWLPAELVLGGDGGFEAVAEVSAGGWFRLEVRLLAEGAVVAFAMVEPVGVGEVFVVAGQSYAASCHEEVLTVKDPMGRVVGASPEEPMWRVAHDPQPGVRARIDLSMLADLAEMLDGVNVCFPFGPHSPFRGSLWPAFAEAMLTVERVPVALVNVAVAGTLVRHWAPATQLFANLVDAVALVDDYRAVLWQQGESDVIKGTTTQEYATQLRCVRHALVARTGLDRPWLPALSTHHPTGGCDEASELPVRAAARQLWDEPGFAPGADTDALRGPEHRAVWLRGAHFTGQGQRAAGLLWADAVHALLIQCADTERAAAPAIPSGA